MTFCMSLWIDCYEFKFLILVFYVKCRSCFQMFIKLQYLEFRLMVCFIALVDRLDVYIHDYLMKRKLHNSAKAFQAEAKVSTDPVGKARKEEI